jgi:uncharacterized protein YbjT (DUF2867 family)
MRVAVAGGTGLVGRYVVEAAGTAGHDVVVLSRSNGVDLVEATGLAEALEGVQAIVDVTNSATTEREPATAFFTAVAESLQRVGTEQGVEHVVTLSIVGIDRVAVGYYAAKLEHERAALAGAVPATILRATPFHEFPGQMIGWNRRDRVARIPRQRVQTVAARTVGDVLVEIAAGAPRGRADDLAGPEPADLVELARAFADRRGLELEIVVDDSGPGIPPGALLPGDDARLAGPTFAEWLAGDDPLAVPL